MITQNEIHRLFGGLFVFGCYDIPMTTPDTAMPQMPKVPGSSPFTIEKIDAVSIPSVEFKDNKLFIAGIEQAQYSAVNGGTKKFQKNNSELLSFGASVGEERDDKNGQTRVIDVNHPETELAVINGYETRGRTVTAVNGKVWDSLAGKTIYYGGYFVEVDPEGNKVVFRQTDSGENNAVIVNNTEWRTHFNNIILATSRFGIVYAIGGEGGRNHGPQKLVIDDIEWVYNKFKEEKQQESYDDVRNAVVSKNGRVAAVVNSIRPGNTWRNHVFIGDKVGAQEKWENTLARVDNIIIDDDSGSVAVFGSLEADGSDKTVIIDDVSYHLEGNPKNLEYFKFQDGGVIIQYGDVLGEKITQKISLRPNAAEMQRKKEEQEAMERGLAELRRLLSERGIPIADIVGLLTRGEQLGQENSSLRTSLASSESRNQELDATKRRLELSLAQESQSARVAEERAARTERQLADLRAILVNVNRVLSGADKTTFGGKYTISGQDRQAILDSIPSQE